VYFSYGPSYGYYDPGYVYDPYAYDPGYVYDPGSSYGPPPATQECGGSYDRNGNWIPDPNCYADQQQYPQQQYPQQQQQPYPQQAYPQQQQQQGNYNPNQQPYPPQQQQQPYYDPRQRPNNQ
jgi:hypothetical protein